MIQHLTYSSLHKGVLLFLLVVLSSFSQEVSAISQDTASHSTQTQNSSTLNLSVEDTTEALSLVADSLSQPKDELRKGTKALRIIMGSLTASFLGMGYYFNQESNMRYNTYLALPEGESRDEAWNDVQSAEQARNLFYVLSGASAIGLTFTFVF